MKWRFTLNNATQGPLVLSDEPIGWNDTTINLNRDKKYQGLTTEFKLGLKFYGEGYQYIKDVYTATGITEDITLLVEVMPSETDTYEDFYFGKLLLTKLEWNCDDGCEVSTILESGDCTMMFRSRSNQAVDLDANTDLDGGPLPAYTGLGTSITLQPKTIVKRTLGADNGTTLTHFDSNGRQVLSGTGSQHMTDVAYFSVPVNTFSIAEIATVNSVGCVYQSSPSLIDNVFECSEPGDFTFEYSDDFGLESAAIFTASANQPDCWTGPNPYPVPFTVFEDWKVELQAYQNGSLVYSNTLLNTTADCNSDLASYPWGKSKGFNNISDTFVLSCLPGDTVKFMVEVTVAGSWERSLTVNNDIQFNHKLVWHTLGNNFNIRAEIHYPATPCKSYLINEALSRTVEAITDDCMRVYSDYFGRVDAEPYTSAADGCGALEVIFKGLHARQFPDVKMLVSFDDIFNALNSIHCIGVGQEPDPNRPGYKLLRVEPIDYWYDGTSIVMDCDNVPEIRIQVNAENYISIFKFGYEKWETENTQGLDEFNTRREYRTTHRLVNGTLDTTCKFIAAGYALEITRSLQYMDDSTKDWRFDNDNFIVCVRRDSGNIVVEQGADCADTAGMTNVVDPSTIYNYRISPIRNLMRWAKILFCNYYPNTLSPTATFIFNNGDGNYQAAGELINGCILEGGAVAENGDITVNSFANISDAAPLYRNETVNFDYPVKYQTFRTWQQNPSLLNGVVRYRTHSSNPWSEGFIKTVQYKPEDGIATFTLIPKFDSQ